MKIWDSDVGNIQQETDGCPKQELIRPANSLVAVRRSNLNLARPRPEVRAQNLEKTKAAIDQLIAIRTGELTGDKGPRTVEYTPRGANATQHTLRIVEKQNDPLEPPRHRYKSRPKELVAVTEETRAPIMRQPARKLSAEEKQEWQIPASVSNWRNDRGFLVDLKTRSEVCSSSHVSRRRGNSDLATALSSAAAEVQQENEHERELLNKQNSLRAKLQAQKDEKNKNSEDMFDQRLFHASKRKHDLYSDTLFTKGASSKRNIRFEK